MNCRNGNPAHKLLSKSGSIYLGSLTALCQGCRDLDQTYCVYVYVWQMKESTKPFRVFLGSALTIHASGLPLAAAAWRAVWYMLSRACFWRYYTYYKNRKKQRLLGGFCCSSLAFPLTVNMMRGHTCKFDVGFKWLKLDYDIPTNIVSYCSPPYFTYTN